MTIPEPLRQQIRKSGRRFVVTGATGWIGRTAVTLLAEALDAEAPARLACFGSRAGSIALSSGHDQPVRPLAQLPDLAPVPTALLHLGFVTKDKVSLQSEGDYTYANQAISDTVYDALDAIGVDRLFLASSGAAAQCDNPAAPADLRLYGALKLEDEHRFARWAKDRPDLRRAAICRVFSVSGSGINKPTTYALADMILRGLVGGPVTVRSPREVWRSYVAASELVALALAILLSERAEPVIRFESGGSPMELGEVAVQVANHLGVFAPVRTITENPPDIYCGDHESWLELLEKYGLFHLPFSRQLEATAAYLARLESEPKDA